MPRQAGAKDGEIKITPEMIEAGKAAFYGVLDMPPFSDATVSDLVSAVACAAIAEFRSGKPMHVVRR